jgi:hypothetical protein
MSTYNDRFFEYVNSGAILSAKRILPLLTKELNIKSVLDVGCAQGAWLSIWKQLGVNDILGLDGDYVNKDKLLIKKDEFCSQDLTLPFTLNRKYDILQCLEVAEHLPEKSANTFVQTLTKHSDLILFSAAPKGQGGDNHINEQDYEYWRQIFAFNGYRVFDYIRPLVITDPKIEEWYKYNTFLYCSNSSFSTLPENIKRSAVAENESLTDISPITYKLRKKLIRLLPIQAMTWMAKIKEAHVVKRRSTA